jgi:hypothetical protein
MYIFDLPGGLGNQIFAYFAAIYTTKMTNARVRLQFSTISKSHVGAEFDLRSFKLEIKPIHLDLYSTVLSPLYFPEKNGVTRRLKKLIPLNTVIHFIPGQDNKSQFDQFLSHATNSFFPKRISGYFGDFSFYDSLPYKSKKLSLDKPSYQHFQILNRLKGHSVVGIHIRAGDYLEMPNSVGILGDQYYLDALAQVFKIQPNVFPIIFTNDYEYAQKRISKWNISNSFIISPELLADPAESLDIYSHCNYIITSNSTFSLWAAKLASEVTQIWTPKLWRRDNQGEIASLPANWRRIDNSWLK